MSAWVGQYEQLKRFCLRTKVHLIFSPNVEGFVVDKILFRFAMYRSGGIRDQSRNLSEIGQNFGRFFALSNFWGPAFQKLYPFYHPYLTARRLEKVL